VSSSALANLLKSRRWISVQFFQADAKQDGAAILKQAHGSPAGVWVSCSHCSDFAQNGINYIVKDLRNASKNPRTAINGNAICRLRNFGNTVLTQLLL
jgi:hypothetical protein